MAELRELVSAAKKGDRDAFSQLYQEVYKDLYKFALYCLKDPSDAEDAVSETVLDAWQGVDRLLEDSAFRPWIFRILSAKCKRTWNPPTSPSPRDLKAANPWSSAGPWPS